MIVRPNRVYKHDFGRKKRLKAITLLNCQIKMIINAEYAVTEKKDKVYLQFITSI